MSTNPPRWQKPFDELKTFLEANPDLRFWQALWAITGGEVTIGGQDPFYWEGLKPMDSEKFKTLYEEHKSNNN